MSADELLPESPTTVSSLQAIEALIFSYAELVDAGDFASVGALFANASFLGSGATHKGRAAVEKMLSDVVATYDDGTPRTRHVVTNLVVTVDESAGTAQARSCVTVMQTLPGFALQTILCGRYFDRFERSGTKWHFAERRLKFDLVGDVSHHLRAK
jgi:hypothetical protein